MDLLGIEHVRRPAFDRDLEADAVAVLLCLGLDDHVLVVGVDVAFEPEVSVPLEGPREVLEGDDAVAVHGVGVVVDGVVPVEKNLDVRLHLPGARVDALDGDLQRMRGGAEAVAVGGGHLLELAGPGADEGLGVAEGRLVIGAGAGVGICAGVARRPRPGSLGGHRGPAAVLLGRALRRVGAAYGAARLLGALSDAEEPTEKDERPEDLVEAPADQEAPQAISTDGLLVAAKDAATGLWGLINGSGQWAVEPAFSEAPGPLREDLARALDPASGLWGYLDRSGSWAIGPSFSAAGDFAEGLAPARDVGTGLWGFMDESGAWAVSPAFDEARSFSAGLAACRQPESQAEAERVRYGQLWGYVDSSGAWAVGPGFNEAGDFSEEGLAPAAATASSWGFVDRGGAGAFEGTWSRAKAFSEGLAAVMRGSTSRWGYVDASGNQAIDARFDDAGAFSGGLAPAKDHDTGLWGFVSAAGTWAVSPTFSGLGSLEEGLAPARDAASGLCGLVDETGSWVVPASFSDLSF